MIYETPWLLPNISDCYFYHSITLTDSFSISGDWDLRPVVDSYLSDYNFNRKRVLDVGTATGFLSFHCEARGAQVVSFDHSNLFPVNTIPGWPENPDGFTRMKNGYWFAHSALRSSNKVIYGNIYDLPQPVVSYQFDVAILGSVLMHLENPFGALRSASKVAKTLIITETHRPYIDTDHAVFRPGMKDGNDYLAWWYLPIKTVINMLRSLGYSTSEPTMLTAHGKAGSVDLYSIVATTD